MARYEIKALSIGGILDQTVALVKNHFGVLLGIAAVVYVPYGLINGFAIMAIMPPAPTPPIEPQVMEEYQEGVVMASLISLPLSLLFVLVGSLANGAMVWAVSRAYLGEPVSFDDSWRHALRRALPLVGATILYSLAIFAGMLLCFIPGYIFMVWFMFYTQTVMLEGLSSGAALSRSKALLKGNMMKGFVLIFLVFVISVAIGAASGFVPQPHIAVVLQVALQAIIVMFSAAAMTVFYFSCRCQAEDFDLMRLAAAVEANDDDAAPQRDATF